MISRLNCRLCGAAASVVLSLSRMPLVDDYDSGPGAERYPTDLLRCDNCGHLQLGVVVEPDLLFRGYSYRTGYSPALVAHFEGYAAAVVRLARLCTRSRVVDIGSNDGTLLKMLRAQSGCEVLGIDPAADGETPAVREMLSPVLADRIVAEFGLADVVTANNVMAHVDDVSSFLTAAAAMLKPGGYFVCEVGDADSMLADCSWEQIYHEHLNYFSIGSLRLILHKASFDLIGIQRVQTHGGSLRAICRKGPLGQSRPRPVPNDFAGQGIIENIATRGAYLRAFIDRETVAFGASAKASVLISQLGLQPRCVVDDNPLKQGKRMPGTDIPICDRSALATASRVLVLAWNEAVAILPSLPKIATLVAAPRPFFA